MATENRKTIFIVAGAVSFVIVLLILYLLFKKPGTEKPEKWVDLGWTNEARDNHYLAAKIFLEKLGISTTIQFNLELLKEMPPETDTLFIANNYEHLSPQQYSALLRWVRDGGHLIMGVDRNNEPDEDDYALDQENDSKNVITNYFGIKNNFSAECDKNYSDSDQKSGVEIIQQAKKESINVSWFGSCEYLSNLRNMEKSLLRAKTVYGDILVQIKHGNGKITFATPALIREWDNYSLDENDHAYLLGIVIANTPTVWIIDNRKDNSPSFLLWLWKHFYLVILSLALLIILWIWKNSFRYEPIKTINDTTRRKLLEHIEANAKFLWRHEKERVLIENLRQHLHQQLAKKYPAYTHFNEGKKVDFLSQLLQVDAQGVREALFSDAQETRSNWLLIISTLQHLRKQL